MSIHRRLAEIHRELMNTKIEKSGYNKHKGFKYYELEDIMPPILDLCYKHEISVEFTFIEEAAILKLVDWNNKKEYIPFRIGLPEIITPEKNPNNQIIQVIGADISYLQRYLLKLAFPCLTDKDMIDNVDVNNGDASSAQNSKVNTSTFNNKPKQDNLPDVNVPGLIVEAEKTLKAKGVEDKDITPKALKRQIMNSRKWSVNETRAINRYFHEKGASK